MSFYPVRKTYRDIQFTTNDHSHGVVLTDDLIDMRFTVDKMLRNITFTSPASQELTPQAYAGLARRVIISTAGITRRYWLDVLTNKNMVAVTVTRGTK